MIAPLRRAAPLAIERSEFRNIAANEDIGWLVASLRREIADLSDGAPGS